jgi:hypothetical protein
MKQLPSGDICPSERTHVANVACRVPVIKCVINGHTTAGGAQHLQQCHPAAAPAATIMPVVNSVSQVSRPDEAKQHSPTKHMLCGHGNCHAVSPSQRNLGKQTHETTATYVLKTTEDYWRHLKHCQPSATTNPSMSTQVPDSTAQPARKLSARCTTFRSILHAHSLAHGTTSFNANDQSKTNHTSPQQSQMHASPKVAPTTSPTAAAAGCHTIHELSYRRHNCHQPPTLPVQGHRPPQRCPVPPSGLTACP